MGNSDRVVLITGASSGIGAGVAAYLVEKEGYGRIALVARREDRLKEVSDECLKLGAVYVLCIPADVGIERECRDAIKKTVDHFGRLDVLVNNAGKGQSSMKLADITMEEFRQVMDVNFYAPFILSQEALPHLEKTKGNIVFISSVAGTRNKINTERACYATSKAALNALSNVFAVSFASKGVRSNVIAPAAIVSEMLLNNPSHGEMMCTSVDEVTKKFRALHPVDRVGKPEEIGRAVAFLASEEAGFVTGVHLPVDGGFLLS